MSSKPALAIFLGLAGSTGVLACSNASAPKSSSPVNFRLAAAASAAPTAATAAVELSSVRLVVGPAALGNGDQFGCVDCQGNDSEAAPQAQLVSVPSDGSPISVAVEQVTAGHYASAEIELMAPGVGVPATPGWPAGATMEIVGKFNGTNFTLPLTAAGEFREALNPPVDVSDGATPASISVTITLPVASWFVSNRVPLDPSDPSQRAQIEQNARLSLRSAETGEATSTSGEK